MALNRHIILINGVLAYIARNASPALWMYCPIGCQYYTIVGGCQQLFKGENDLYPKLLTCAIIGLYEGPACYVHLLLCKSE